MPWINEVSKHIRPFWPLPWFCHELFLLSTSESVCMTVQVETPAESDLPQDPLGNAHPEHLWEESASEGFAVQGQPFVRWLSWSHDGFPNRKISLSQLLSIHFSTCLGIHHTWHWSSSFHWPTMKVAVFSTLSFTKQHWLEEGLAIVLSRWRHWSKYGWTHGMGRTNGGARHLVMVKHLGSLSQPVAQLSITTNSQTK